MEKPASSRKVLLPSQWDTGETLAQKTSSQQQMHIHYHDQNGYKLSQKENVDYLQQGDNEYELANDDVTDDKVYDSLEEESISHATRNLLHPHSEYIETKINQQERKSQLASNDDYSDLRYDPNWRTNLKRNSCFINSPQKNITTEEYYPEEKSRLSCATGQALKINGGYRYIADTTPVVVVTPYMGDSDSDQPYCLHPQDDQTSSVTFPLSQEADLSNPSSSSTKNESKNTDMCENGLASAGHNSRTSPEPREHLHAAEFQTCHQPEWRQHIQGRPVQPRKMSSPALTSPNKKLERLTEDIVERNKITLGRTASKCGSYTRAHAVKQKMPGHVNEVHESVKETSSAEIQVDCSDPQLNWLQKTQQLRVAQISKGKKARRKYPSPSQQPQTSAPEVRSVQGGESSSLLVRPTQPEKTTSSQPVPSTIHLNLNLNTSSHLLSLLQHTGQDALINLACLCSHTAMDVQTVSPPRNCEKEGHTPPQKSPIITSSRGLGSYTVLPPIENQPTGKEHELSPGQCVNTAYPLQRSGSDSYLSQMEKQKKLKERVPYKEYSLKDYKQLNPVTNLQGLGPDYTAIAKTAEKMKRQKLYSNVICEQNKKISRIPFLLAKDPESNDKKVPRMKALEYAKTIARPSLQSQPKQKQKHQSELVPYLEELDISKLAKLELLRQRHEKEKQAVACFGKVHAV